jgi:hypothetical protein
MRTIILAAALATTAGMAAFAAQQPAPVTSGPTEVFIRTPAGTTITNFYKQNVYDPADAKIGDVDDLLLDKEGRVTAVIVGVGGFLGMGGKGRCGPIQFLARQRESFLANVGGAG